MNLVSRCRCLAKAKDSFQGHSLEAYKQTLKDLSSLGINPVTIPKRWGCRHIPNLLYTYYDKVQKERREKQQMERFLNGGYIEYVKEFGYPIC